VRSGILCHLTALYPLDGGLSSGNPAISVTPTALPSWRLEIGGFASPSYDGFALESKHSRQGCARRGNSSAVADNFLQGCHENA